MEAIAIKNNWTIEYVDMALSAANKPGKRKSEVLVRNY
jgi:hypothetical protein